MNKTIVKTEKLTKTYNLYAEEIVAVNGVDLEITAGEFVSIMGPSGSGKTTLLDMIGCLDAISSGRLEILGQEVSNISESKLVNIRLGDGLTFRDNNIAIDVNDLSGEDVEAVKFTRCDTIHHCPDRVQVFLGQAGYTGLQFLPFHEAIQANSAV